jgi:uncharacterized protein (TIGR02145 family)
MKKTLVFLTIFLLHLGDSIAQYSPQVIVVKRDEIEVKINTLYYRTIYLGQQRWTLESIKARSYNDGKPITHIYGDRDWNSTQTGAFRITKPTKKNSYGYEYNGYAVETNKLCPKGWRAGTLDDYRELAEYLRSDSVKYSRYSHMIDTNQYSISEGRPIRCVKEE